MKKIISLLLALVLLFTVACGSETTQAETSQIEETEPQVVASYDKFLADNISTIIISQYDDGKAEFNFDLEKHPEGYNTALILWALGIGLGNYDNFEVNGLSDDIPFKLVYENKEKTFSFYPSDWVDFESTDVLNIFQATYCMDDIKIFDECFTEMKAQLE